jgi:hypothetical protein
MGRIEKINILNTLEEKILAKKMSLVGSALSSTDPNELVKAQAIASKYIENRELSDRKSILIDPLDFATSLGYKDKAMGMSYDNLKRMARVPVISAIIKTRVNQVAAFAEPQKDKFSTGFKILKRGKENSKLTKAEQARVDEITQFILNCGTNNSWEADDFDSFIRKVTRDSLVFDQLTFEVIYNRKGLPIEFIATDASTFRISDSVDDDSYQNQNKEKIKGYYPSFCQVDNGQVVADFYPWELCFGVRNPESDIHNFGYGVSELEELVTTITSMLWSDEYNRRFFSQGSAPKGIIRVDGSVSPAKIQEFKQQWQAMVSGVHNAWKTPVMEAGKMEFINLQTANKDMEFKAWQDYLIKTACAIYCISPEEIGFSQSGGAENRALFESNNEGKLKHSKDKGLYPLLKFIASRLNKYVVNQLDKDYYLSFVGIDALSQSEELDMAVKKVTNFATLNEVREELGYPKIKDPAADNVMSSTYSQFKMAAQQMGMGGEQEGGEVQPEDGEEDYSDMPTDDSENPFE